MTTILMLNIKSSRIQYIRHNLEQGKVKSEQLTTKEAYMS